MLTRMILNRGTRRRVIIVMPDRLACFTADSGIVVLDREWQITDAELATGFSAYLDENKDAEFSLFLDLPEEECHLETLNAVGLRDRQYLIERVKNKRFEHALLSRASVTSQHKKYTLTLSGVDTNVSCEKVLKLFAEKCICLRAIHSAITLTGAISKLTGVHKKSNLFVVRLHSCYRLIASLGSMVLFTRRISVCRDGELADTQNIATLKRSLEETLVYVQRLQAEVWVPTVVLIGFHSCPAQSRELEEFASDSTLVKGAVNYQSPPVTDESAEPYAESMLAAAAMRCGNGYAQQQHRRIYLSRKVRNVSAALALCGVGGALSSVAIANKLSGAHAVVAQSYSQSTSRLSSNVADLELNYEQPVEAVRQALVTAKLVQFGSAYRPLEFLQWVAEDVQRYQNVSVNAVRWEIDEVVSGPSIARLLSQSEYAETLNLEQIYHATVEGVIEGRPESALSEFESFVSALRNASSNPNVIVLETPFGLGGQNRATLNDFSASSGNFVLEMSSQAMVQ